MCVANLNVTLQPCSHRWYKLVRSCSDSTNLASCPQRLKLEGWETKNDECPWCSPLSSPISDPDDTTHKLFGGMSPTTDRRRSESSAGSSQSPPRGRSLSFVESMGESGSSSQDGDDESKDIDRAERHRMMNRRIEAYIMMNPAKVLTDRSESELPRVDEHPYDTESVSRNASIVSKKWKRGMRSSKGMFRR